MSSSGKEPVRGHPQTDEESSRSYFNLSKHLTHTAPPALTGGHHHTTSNEGSHRAAGACACNSFPYR